MAFWRARLSPFVYGLERFERHAKLLSDVLLYGCEPYLDVNGGIGIRLYEEIFKYQEYFKYYHIADAKHPTDEGVQIGLGEIEFDRISNLFKQKSAQYIPEVWNGHLDNFKGFKEALKKLENL